MHSVTLLNDVAMPVLGFGTYKLHGDELRTALSAAVADGYRLIDTASFYENEADIGTFLNEDFRQSGLSRSDLFITSKVWKTQMGYDGALFAFEQSLKALGTDYLDLYLIHWPAPAELYDKPQRVTLQTWQALERLYGEGRVRAVGVSNFSSSDLRLLSDNASEMPMLNQIHMHPGLSQRAVRDYCATHRIAVQAWRPLGKGAVLENPVIQNTARETKKTPAQVALRWVIQSDVCPLVKSKTPSRILENAQVFDFELTPQQMQAIDDLAPVKDELGILN